MPSADVRTDIDGGVADSRERRYDAPEISALSLITRIALPVEELDSLDSAGLASGLARCRERAPDSSDITGVTVVVSSRETRDSTKRASLACLQLFSRSSISRGIRDLLAVYSDGINKCDEIINKQGSKQRNFDTLYST